jgi:hypothetical protein
MQQRKVIAGVMPLVLVAGLAIFSVWCAKRPVLAWRVVDVRPRQYYFVVDYIQECWRVDIEASNMTASEVIVDWHRDKTAFQIAGKWEDLGIEALMPYLEPNESRTFPVYVPQQAQACRLLMHYEHGPLWARADEFFRGRGVYLPDKYFMPAMMCNKRLPGHFRRLDIEVKLPARTSKAGETKGTHNFLPDPTAGTFSVCGRARGVADPRLCRCVVSGGCGSAER